MLILIIAFLQRRQVTRADVREPIRLLTRDTRLLLGARGLFGWASTSWTAIACVFIRIGGASLVIMIIPRADAEKPKTIWHMQKKILNITRQKPKRVSAMRICE